MIQYPKKYDVIVVGAGHAGCEAALASARMGLSTLLLTMNLDSVGQMSCNPSIGGLAKGQVVREVDALGGEMAQVTDLAGLQFRMLNRSKGPAVQSLRVQCDKKRYQLTMKHRIEMEKNCDLRQGEAVHLLVEETSTDANISLSNSSLQTQNSAALAAGKAMPKRRVVGVVTKTGIQFFSQAVILTTGTFLKGILHYGLDHLPGGRSGDGRAEHLSDSLRNLGFEVGRMKTGTPMRIHAKTIDYAKCIPQPGDEPPTPFSYRTEKIVQKQLPCYLTYTNENTHDIIRKSLDRSPLYTGKIKSIGPRYCPSIEDKVVKFPHHLRHQIFLEPEGYETEEVYVNGLSTSLPEDVQWEVVRSTPGLEKAELMRAGYAVEYDYCPPTQCWPTFETKLVENLFFAGQICGTTGYEEAAGQGLLAGINAARKVKKESPFVLKRNEAYLGVMVDDLVTKGVDEPYRLFTSRAEYRLLLRHDNADLRLMDYTYQLGLISKETYEKFEEYRQKIADRLDQLNHKIKSKTKAETETIAHGNFNQEEAVYSAWDENQIMDQVAIQKKYSGYLVRQEKMVVKTEKMENKRIPPHFNYDETPGLLTESRQKLKKITPQTLGQAARIPGVTPSDISILLVYIERMKHS